MSDYLFTLAKSILLVTALSLDAFVTGFAYGAGRVRIPFRSVAVINIICTAFLSLSMLLGSFLLPRLPSFLPTAVCFVLLFTLGLIKLLHRGGEETASGMPGVPSAPGAPDAPGIPGAPDSPGMPGRDAAGAKFLPPAKAAVLAVALSLDGLAAGFGASLLRLGLKTIIVLSLLSNTAAILGGCHMGNKLAEKSSVDLTWLGGVMLMLLAVMKLAS